MLQVEKTSRSILVYYDVVEGYNPDELLLGAKDQPMLLVWRGVRYSLDSPLRVALRNNRIKKGDFVVR